MNPISQNRIMFNLVALLVGLFCSFQISWASDISRENVIDLVNYSRIKNGLNVLAENSKLNEAALAKAQDMLKNNYFSHNSPEGVTPWFWFEENDYVYQYAGENLAINFKNAEEEHEAWMESADHKKNILSLKYQEIGVAVEKGVIDNKPATVTVQLFGSREDFGVVLGQAAQKDSLDLLNRELESGPWGQMAFVKSPATQVQAAGGEWALKNKIPENLKLDKGFWIELFKGISLLLLLAAVGANPLIFGWFVIQKRKKYFPSPVYPVNIAVIK